ncbi:DNA-binding transcriptional regulator, LysR family [Candidatus Pantoea symbiotica]|uniref:DNA-binding transcriptional regulator, LysR family n=1 Tax=Candidatus Pantoea symbiotica TaxID=1884370 RepID=A0A1I3YXG5_9GAMM|nr:MULTISPECIES: LysR family transcriptional regulator [Pantoea]SFK36525.1 DNA-binding transcriptional regulator, LysR family [Pantoea symbiotica]SFU87900.1 DNA-binding transcriptional regulator, LysR family [Pantoea sp. YR525]
MHSINENDFARIDLNLLVVLLVMYEVRSVTQAANRLYLGQPAVSAALKRLREMFDDPLFVRASNGMTPTPRAEQLVQQFAPLMQDLHRVIFTQQPFNPAEDSYSFRIGMSDWIEHWLMPDLLAELARVAPKVDVKVIATDPWQAIPLMEQQQADVVMTVGNETSRDLTREKILRAGFSTVWHRDQIQLGSPLTLQQFVSYEHALVSYRGVSESALDRQLQQHGMARRVRYVTPHFSALPMLLKRLPLFATVPQGLVPSWCALYDLSAAPVPVSMPDYEVSLLWHNARSEDAANRWLRDVLRGLIMNKL